MMHLTVTLLTVDDNQTDRANYARMLKNSPHVTFKFLEAENAKTALELLKKENIDCILLDYMLPDKNGLELLKIIKDKFCEFIPIIMLTGHGDENIAVSAMKEGATDYLVKDKIESEILTKTIINAIKTARLKKTIHEQEKRLEYFAYYDNLTGLINRHTFEECARQALTYAERHHDMLAILLIDLDNFITINDTYGQLTGNDILIETAVRLKKILPEDALVSRCGDDEFAVLITGPDMRELPEKLAERILNEIMKPVPLTMDRVHVSASIGIARYPIDNKDGVKLLNNAYTALRHAKLKGRGMILHYSSDMK